MQIINSYFRSVPSKIEGAVHVVILTSGDEIGMRDFACYEGIATLSQSYNEEERKQIAEWVAAFGNKLRYDAAKIYFADIPAEKYRG